MVGVFCMLQKPFSLILNYKYCHNVRQIFLHTLKRHNVIRGNFSMDVAPYLVEKNSIQLHLPEIQQKSGFQIFWKCGWIVVCKNIIWQEKFDEIEVFLKENSGRLSEIKVNTFRSNAIRGILRYDHVIQVNNL